MPSARVPLAVGWAARRARELLDPVVAWERRHDTGVPPRRLRARTGAPGARDFLEGGHQAAQELATSLEASGRSFGELASILDFGCGSGRVLPHVAMLAPQAQCVGCDVDASAIRWAGRKRPELRWVRSGSAPPLPFGDGAFELVYSISVFSHLDEPAQDQWLAEIDRVLAAGGVALLSVHGAHAFEQFRTGVVRSSWSRPHAFARAGLRPEEFAFEPYRRSVWNRSELPGVGVSYGLAFHGSDYIRRRWGSMFEVVAVLERAMTGWQDVVVCSKR